MKPYKLVLLLLLFILITVLMPFYLLTKDNLYYEYIGELHYMWDREDHVIENLSSGEGKIKVAFIDTSWYQRLKEKMDEGKWENKERKEKERLFKEDHSGQLPPPNRRFGRGLSLSSSPNVLRLLPFFVQKANVT